MSVDEEIVDTFPWPSSRTPNCQCRITIREDKNGTRNVHIDTLHGDTGHTVKGIYFPPNEMIDLLQALQRANKMI